MCSFFIFSFKNFVRRKCFEMVGVDNEKSRIGWVATRSGDLEEEIFFSAVIGPSREIVAVIPRNASNVEGFISPHCQVHHIQ